MTSSERLNAVFTGATPDRLPVLGGWIACVAHLCALAGATKQDYRADPEAVAICAYRAIVMDGLIDVFVARGEDEYRCVDDQTYLKAGCAGDVDAAVAAVDALPTPEQIEASFDFAAEYAAFRSGLVAGQQRCAGMLWLPAQWDASARVTWYGEFGYENFFCLVGIHPDRARKLLEIGGARARCKTRLIARAVQEGVYPRAVLMGEDICTQRGPMIAPDFLEKYWAPQVRYALEPLRAAGCKAVWHCDGDVRPLLGMLLDAGVEGLQGFQPECGLTIEYVASLRTREGAPLLIFGPVSVTTELPVLQPEQVRAAVRHARAVTRGKADLVLFTANTINPDVPLENIRALYDLALRA